MNATARTLSHRLTSRFSQRFAQRFAPLFALSGLVLLAGCVTSARVATAPAHPATVVVAPPPPPAVIVQPAYVPQQNDAYVSVVLDRDVVYVGGYTYLWIVGADGHRHRHLYGRGDLRGEVLHRRTELHAVMARNDGHLPMQHPHSVAPGQRVHVTMDPHAMPPRGAHAQPHRPVVASASAHGAGRPPAHDTHDAHGGPHHAAPTRNASANGHRHPETSPKAPASPRFAGSPPHAG
ncbi:hypothetical protein [Paraburkholderia acidisoli]|uniref:Uncharacterized protein n=1 Tax=Paraburkholderia acidisoli TaxID=2571748 RepID=A0A7Z2GQ16_9BURK|nr:hypothetical protein [Paraburkholderia acidisoli]QGZ65866.1 hypothetical protein FAZ98_28920 [Paraburkholderia acidisoli]